MKNLTRWTLAGALAALVVMPGRAEAQPTLVDGGGLYSGEACGGTSFEFCADVTLELFQDTDGSYFYMLTVNNLWSENTCLGEVECVIDGDVFTRMGLINLPRKAMIDGRMRNVDADYFISQGTPVPENWEFNGNQGLSGNNAYGAGSRIAYNTISGITNGLRDEDGSISFRFNVNSTWTDLEAMKAVGWGIHAQGVGLDDCSSKMGGVNGSVIDSEVEDDGLSCVPVPEPGTNALLAIGMVGLAFVAVRRRSLSELLG